MATSKRSTGKSTTKRTLVRWQNALPSTSLRSDAGSPANRRRTRPSSAAARDR